MSTYNLNDCVLLKTRKKGIIRYIGKIKSKKSIYYGIELMKAEGNNNGTFKSNKYFKCEPQHGIFVKQNQIMKPIRYSNSLTSIKQLNNKKQIRMTIPNKEKETLQKILSYYSRKFYLNPDCFTNKQLISVICLYINHVPFKFININSLFDNIIIKDNNTTVINYDSFNIIPLGYNAIFPFDEWNPNLNYNKYKLIYHIYIHI